MVATGWSSRCARSHDQIQEVDEALRHIREAIELYLESLREDGQPVPVGDRDVRVEDVKVTV